MAMVAEDAVTSRDIQNALEVIQSLLGGAAKRMAALGKMFDVWSTNQDLKNTWDVITEHGTKEPLFITLTAQTEDIWREVLSKTKEYNANVPSEQRIYAIRQGGIIFTNEESRRKLENIAMDIMIERGRVKDERPNEQFTRVTDGKMCTAISGVDESVVDYIKDNSTFGKDILFASTKNADGTVNVAIESADFMNSKLNKDDMFTALFSAKMVTSIVKDVKDNTDYKLNLYEQVLNHSGDEPLIVASAKANNEFMAVTKDSVTVYAMQSDDRGAKAVIKESFGLSDYQNKAIYQNAVATKLENIWQPLIVDKDVAEAMMPGVDGSQIGGKIAAVKHYLDTGATDKVKAFRPKPVDYDKKLFVEKLSQAFSNHVEHELTSLDASLNAKIYVDALKQTPAFSTMSASDLNKLQADIETAFKANQSIFIENGANEKAQYNELVSDVLKTESLTPAQAKVDLNKLSQGITLVDTLNDKGAITQAVAKVKSEFYNAPNAQPGTLTPDMQELMNTYKGCGGPIMLSKLAKAAEQMLSQQIDVRVNEIGNPIISGADRLGADVFERTTEKEFEPDLGGR